MNTIKILIIAKSQHSIEKISTILKGNCNQFDIKSALYWETAAICLNENQYDVILLELENKNKENIELFEKTINSAKNTPIITLINIIDKSIVSYLMKRSYWDYLYMEKITFEELTNAIKYITQKNRKELTLKFDDSVFSKIIGSKENHIFVTNNEGIISYANSHFARLFELTINEIIGLAVDISFIKNNTNEIKLTSNNNCINYIEIVTTKSIQESEEYLFVSVQDISHIKDNEKWNLLKSQIYNLTISSKKEGELITEICALIKESANIEAISIRNKISKTYNFGHTIGYSEDFMVKTNNLCNCFTSDNFVADIEGSPVPECLSSILTETEPFQCNFTITSHGCCWSNNLNRRIYIKNSEANKFINTCKPRIEGYNTIALIPIRSNNLLVGILQINDKRENILSDEIIRHLEEICSLIGTIIVRQHKYNTLNEAKDPLLETTCQQNRSARDY